MRGLLWATVAAMLVVTGCGKVIGPPEVVSGAGYKLYEAANTKSSQLVAVIDTRSHAVERTLPWGTLSGEHLYSVTATTLADIDPRTGSTTRTLRLPGYFQLPQATISGVAGGLSQDGHWLVLERQPNQPGSTGSHMVLVDTAALKVTAVIDLTGSFQFDAISNDGQRIYMIEYLYGSSYRVRVYNVPAGHMESYIVVDKSDASESMTGLRLSGVASPDGQWLYSVYARPNKSAFIHALNLSQPYAFCIELPGSGYESSSDEFQWSLALSVDGKHLFAANGAKGIVSEIYADSNNGPSITRTSLVDASTAPTSWFAQDVEAKELATGGAVLSPDGKTLVITGKTGLLWLDTATLSARSHQLSGWKVTSLGLSSDGSMVYALNNAAMIAELSMASPGKPTTFGATGAQPLALIRVDAPLAP